MLTQEYLIEPYIVYFMVSMAFVSGLASGWGIFQVIQVKKEVAKRHKHEHEHEHQEQGQLVETPAARRPNMVDKTKALTCRPKWSRGDEDWLLKNDIDMSRVASEEDRPS